MPAATIRSVGPPSRRQSVVNAHFTENVSGVQNVSVIKNFQTQLCYLYNKDKRFWEALDLERRTISTPSGCQPRLSRVSARPGRRQSGVNAHFTENVSAVHCLRRTTFRSSTFPKENLPQPRRVQQLSKTVVDLQRL